MSAVPDPNSAGDEPDAHRPGDERSESTATVEFGFPPPSTEESISWLPAAAPTLSADNHARAALSLQRQGRHREALGRFREAVRLRPDRAEYHYRLALCAWNVGEPVHVEPHLREAARLAPKSAAVREAMGQWFFEAADVDSALAHSAAALQLAPNDPNVAVSRAIVLEGAGRLQEAWNAIQPLLESGRVSGRLGMVYARLAPAIGKEADALATVQRLIDSPELGEADKAPLRFGAAALLDRAGRYGEAFDAARLAKHATRRPYDPTATARRVDQRIRYYTPSKLHALPRAEHRNRRPVFIVGMPRSGTSLVEQILASHPAVYGGGELVALSRVANNAARADWAEGEICPEFLESISVRRANQLAQQYLGAIERLNRSATYVTDKMPLNFLYLGLIALLFPDCHVIHCRRNPMDTCLSCFMTFFANGHEFSHDLTHLGLFYRGYARQMVHWQSALNFPIIEVNYEDVVADAEGQTRRLLALLDLPWDDRCLAFHRTARPVATASSAQVRRPIYASSVGRWKHYEPYLADLIAALDAPP